MGAVILYILLWRLFQIPLPSSPKEPILIAVFSKFQKPSAAEIKLPNTYSRTPKTHFLWKIKQKLAKSRRFVNWIFFLFVMPCRDERVNIRHIFFWQTIKSRENQKVTQRKSNQNFQFSGNRKQIVVDFFSNQAYNNEHFFNFFGR